VYNTAVIKNNMNLEELKQKKERQINGFFILMIEIAFIFAIPALVAVWGGKYLDKNETGSYTISFLVLSFVFSWIIIILLYKKKTRELRKTEDLIQQKQK